jgi:hypothetical protein
LTKKVNAGITEMVKSSECLVCMACTLNAEKLWSEKQQDVAD